MKELAPKKSLKQIQRAGLADKVAILLTEGATVTGISHEIGMSKNAIYRLMEDYPETLKRIHADVKHAATLERQRNLKRLTEIRDDSENHLAAVRAIEAIDGRAGMSLDRQEAGVTVQIFGENFALGDLRGADLRALAHEMAKKLGMDEKIIDAEFAVEPARETGVGEPGGDSAGTPEADPPRPPDQARDPA